MTLIRLWTNQYQTNDEALCAGNQKYRKIDRPFASQKAQSAIDYIAFSSARTYQYI